MEKYFDIFKFVLLHLNYYRINRINTADLISDVCIVPRSQSPMCACIATRSQSLVCASHSEVNLRCLHSTAESISDVCIAPRSQFLQCAQHRGVNL